MVQPSERLILPGQEIKERQPLRGRNIFITGGLTGLGLQTARKLYNLGADLTLSTHTPQHAKHAEGVFDPRRLRIVTMDLTDRNQIDAATNQLHGITDFIHSAAEGMGPAKTTIGKTLAALKKFPPDSERGQALIAKMVRRIEEVMPYSMVINHDGPTQLLERVQEILPPDGWFVFFSSLPSSVNPEWAKFYKGVALSKNAFEKEIIDRAPDLAAQGIYTAIVSGNVLADSAVGQMIDDLVIPLVPPDQQEAMRATFVTYADMVRETMNILEADPREFPIDDLPVRKYVVTPTEVTGTLSADHPVFQFKIPA